MSVSNIWSCLMLYQVKLTKSQRSESKNTCPTLLQRARRCERVILIFQFPAASNHSTLWILITLLKNGACWKPGTWDGQAGGSQQNHVPEYPGLMPRTYLKQQQQQHRKNLELRSREGLQCSSTTGKLNPQRTFHSLFITTVGKGVVILYPLDTVRVIWEEGTSNREACTPSQSSLRSQSPWNLHTLKLFRYTRHMLLLQLWHWPVA